VAFPDRQADTGHISPPDTARVMNARTSERAPRRTFRQSLSWAFARYAYVFPLMFFGLWLPRELLRTDNDRDSVAYWWGARQARTGQEIYWPIPEPGPHLPGRAIYVYPPPFAAAVAPTAGESYVPWARGWLLVVSVGFWVYAASVARLWTGRVGLRATLMAGAAMGSLPPVLEAMASAQVDILIWAAIGVAFAWRPARGAGLAFVAIVKIFSGWALAVWAVRDRRVIPGAAAVSAVALLACLAVLGPGRTVSETRVWITRVAPTLAQGQRDGRARASQTLLGRPVSETLPANFSVAFFPYEDSSSVFPVFRLPR
jgi:hypothetical protein